MTKFASLEGGVDAAYDTAGSGPPILLLHGLQGGRRMLAELARHLATKLTVINVDQRDSGETRNPPEPYDLARLADDAATFVEAIGLKRVHVFGTSFGSRIAQALAIRHPQVVDRLVLGAAWPLPQSMQEANPEGLKRFMDIRGRLPESAGELAEMFVPKAFLDNHPDVRRALVGMPDPPDKAARRAAAAQTTCGSAADITAPTLVIAGEVDQMVPAPVTVGIASLIRGATARTLPGVGHAASLQDPASLAQAITDFLD